MNEEKKMDALKRFKEMTHEERETQHKKLEETMSQKELDMMKFIAISAGEILKQLGMANTAENAAKIFEPLILLAKFDEVYDDADGEFKAILKKHL